MAIKSRMPSSGAIEKAIEALNDGLEISGAGTEVQLPEKEVNFEPDVEPGDTLSVSTFKLSLSVKPPNLYASCTDESFTLSL